MDLTIFVTQDAVTFYMLFHNKKRTTYQNLNEDIES